jgi:hypothetical protein
MVAGLWLVQLLYVQLRTDEGNTAANDVRCCFAMQKAKASVTSGSALTHALLALVFASCMHGTAHSRCGVFHTARMQGSKSCICMVLLSCWVAKNADCAAPALQRVLSCCSGASSSAVDIPGERSMEDDAVLLADDEEMGALTASTLQGSPPADGTWQGDAAAAASPPIEDMVMVEQMDAISAAPAEDTAAEEAPADAAAAAAEDGEAAAATSQEEAAAAPAAAGTDAAVASGSVDSTAAEGGTDNGMSANPFAPSAAAEEPQQHGNDASAVPAQQEGSADAAPVAATSNSGSPTSAVPPPAEGSSSSDSPQAACGGIKAHWQGKSHPVQVPDEF